MVPLLLALYVGRLGDGGAPLLPRIMGELANHFSYMNAALGDKDWFAGDAMTACDVQMSFPLEAGQGTGLLGEYPNLAGFLDRVQARPAYKKALEKGGPYKLGG